MNSNKLIAIFLAVIMVGALFAILFSGVSPPAENDENTQEAIPFDSIPGNKINQPFGSIADALSMTPEGVTSAQYRDISSIEGTPLEMLMDIQELDSIYGSQVVSTYSAYYDEEESWFQLDVIRPEVVAFQYGEPVTYDGYFMLPRAENIYNVIGSPLILGPRDKVEAIIDIVNTDMESTSQFDSLLNYAQDNDSEFQIVNSLSEDNYADKVYIGFSQMDGQNYIRTVVYQNLSQDTMDLIGSYEANSTERGLAYSIEEDDEFTKVVVEGNFFTLINEPMQ
ncbi:conserved hypothetical protein [Methanosalsum zhilinae DSM 4017]|uniref:Uncharacterized protein n=1 Tax=Methanosalsum zhilinae (strain DSM 4017 / NBRC 107636 / OCM 62 / WeN5) TaxID=679901 RepID=F7XN04_METZD|nr:hypothetical protein [Methanosalsum zhilinae]AEH61113.1 conserved hypothetical protein [Methanosalsum zhilinae DSM 4017]